MEQTASYQAPTAAAPTRRPAATIARFAVLLTLALAGCGSTNTPIATIVFKSAAITGPSIPARYTCDGKNITPPLEWGETPTGTHELVLMIIGLKPSSPTGSYQISVEWAAAGINPNLHHLAAGQLPPNAYPGISSNGNRHYSICPPRGTKQLYQFQLYAVPPRLQIAKHFTGLAILATLSKPNTPASATAQGAFVTTYKRS